MSISLPMYVLAEQPMDAIIGIAILLLLFGGIWAFSYTEKMWLRRGIDTTFDAFQTTHPSALVVLRGLVAMLIAYVSVIGPVALIPALCAEAFGKDTFTFGLVVGLAWMGFAITIGKAFLFPAIRAVFHIPPRDLTPYTGDRAHESLQAEK